jgi:hypothetical protein
MMSGFRPDIEQEQRHFPGVIKLQPEFVTVSTSEIMGYTRSGFFLSCVLMLSTAISHAQNLSGQWTGTFATSNDPFGGKTEYVMELEIKGDRVEGHSYTYFVISGKRHYVICKLDGSYDKGSKSVIVTEKEKVKSNTPPDFKDLFQTHRLTYFRQDDREVLEGKWRPASEKEPPQFGITNLERRSLAKIQTAAPTPDITKRTPLGTAPAQGNRVIASNKSDSKQTPKPTSPAVQTPKPSKPQPSSPAIAAITTPRIQSPTPGTRERPSEAAPSQGGRTEVPTKLQTPPVVSSNTIPNSTETGSGKIEQRTKRYIEVIELDDPQFKVELYDNGQVDGDTISLFFNNRLMVAQKRLSTTPIALELMLDKSKPDNELVMYAENLGSIPPNTALMVVTVKDKRYEVNITSTEDVNGAVRFRLRQ